MNELKHQLEKLAERKDAAAPSDPAPASL